MRRILLASDFSRASEAAFAFAEPLVRKYRAELHLVHVFAPEIPIATTAALPLILPDADVRRHVELHLKQFAAASSLSVRPEHIHALMGRPFEEICRLANEKQIDLIITGTRGRTGLKHLVLGSTAERVVRHAGCPVLVVRSSGRARGRRNLFRTIIAPTDFSRCSDAGLMMAQAVARDFDSRLVLMHSIDLHYYSTNPEYIVYDFPPLLEAAQRAARDQLGEAAEQLHAAGVKVETKLEFGHPGDLICRAATDRRADLIITATHGRTGMKHALLGSTAEYVVRHAPCSVLVVPSMARNPKR